MCAGLALPSRPGPRGPSPRPIPPAPHNHADGSLRPPTRRLSRAPRRGAGRAGRPSAPRRTAAPEGQRPDDRRLNSRPPGPPSNTGTSAPLHSEPGFRFHQLPPPPTPRRPGLPGVQREREGPSRRAARPLLPPIGAGQLSPAWRGGAHPRDRGDVVRGRGGQATGWRGVGHRDCDAQVRPAFAEGLDRDPTLLGEIGQLRRLPTSGQMGLTVRLIPGWEEPVNARESL